MFGMKWRRILHQSEEKSDRFEETLTLQMVPLPGAGPQPRQDVLERGQPTSVVESLAKNSGDVTGFDALRENQH